VQRHGKPVAFYSDKHSIFRVYHDGTTGRIRGITQFGRAAPLIDEALDLTLGTEARARIQVAREVDGGAVRTDPGLVRHLLTNLMANAVEAMPNGGRLEVQARHDGRDLVLPRSTRENRRRERARKGFRLHGALSRRRRAGMNPPVERVTKITPIRCGRAMQRTVRSQ
jgi:hypothetical protein